MAEPFDPGADIGHVHLKVPTSTAPSTSWPRPPGGDGVAMGTEPLDLRDLLSELSPASGEP
jgi:catechol-2,3-dioxygenase